MSSALSVSAVRSPPSGRGGPAHGVLTILVIDDSPLCRELSAEALRSQGFKTLQADSGVSALAMLATSSVDLILLDNEMPQMGGIGFLKALRAQPQFAQVPVIMLTSTTSKEVVVGAMRLGVRGYLLKEKFSLPELMTRIRAALGPAVAPQRPAHAPSAPPVAADHLPAPAPKSAPPPPRAAVDSHVDSHSVASTLVSRERTLQAVTEILGARTLPGVVADIITQASSPRAGLTDLAATIKRDPVFSARVLQVSNSAAYAGARPHTPTIDDAVRMIGAATIRTLAMSVGVFDAFPPLRSDGLELLRCWQHAIAVGTVMSEIVPRNDAVPVGIPYLIGLCHDLAEILLRQRFPDEFAAATEFAQDAAAPVSQIFPAFFGLPYVELVDAMLAGMKLPAAISDPIGQYSRHARSPVEAHAGLIPRALAIADFFAHSLLLTTSADDLVAPVLESDCTSVLIPTSQIDWAAIRTQAVNTTSTLSRLKPDESAAAGRPFLPRQETRIGYIRHATFAELDPLAAAFANLFRLDIIPHPPRVEDLAGVAGLVVVTPAHDRSAVSEALRLRSLMREEFPILHVTAPGSHTFGSAPALEEVQYPVSLRRLEQFGAML